MVTRHHLTKKKFSYGLPKVPGPSAEGGAELGDSGDALVANRRDVGIGERSIGSLKPQTECE